MRENIKFTEYKDRILEALQKKGTPQAMGITESVTLIDGFVSISLNKEINPQVFALGGPSIPMVVLLGKETGRMYFFALKAILPEVDL